MRTDFFIVGTAKAGTSALHEYLSGRQEVCMCSVKEPNFFSHEEIEENGLYYKKHNVRTEEEYQRLFHARPSTRLFGEASVSYLYYPSVAKRIHDYNPQAKILICLREPVRRAYSHYCMDFALGLVKKPIETIWRNGVSDPETGKHYQQYFQVSHYAPQLKKYLDVFPREQILIILHEDLCLYPDTVMSRIAGFLGLDASSIQQELPLENVSGLAKTRLLRWLYRHQGIRKSLRALLSDGLREGLKSLLFSRRGLPTFPVDLQLELARHYEPMTESLSVLTGLDLECWKKKSALQPTETMS